MRAALIFALAVSLACTGEARATGFGWYVCSIHWSTLQERSEEFRREAEGLLALGDSSWLRSHLQEEADARVLEDCDEYGSDASPRGFEMYSPEFVAYAEAYQRGKGVTDTLFSRFRVPPEFVRIQTRPPRPMIHPVYFVLSPRDVEALHAEVAIMNRDRHPPEHAMMLRQLEGLLLMTSNDLWFAPPADDPAHDSGQRALVIHGHD